MFWDGFFFNWRDNRFYLKQYPLIYLKSNSIFLTSFIHAFWNFSIGCLLGSNISGIKVISILEYVPKKPFYLSGGDFGFEGSLITSLFFLMSCVFLYRLKPNESFKKTFYETTKYIWNFFSRLKIKKSLTIIYALLFLRFFLYISGKILGKVLFYITH